MSTNRIRALLVSMLASLAIGAVASASASAHEFSVPCHKVSAANKEKGEWEKIGATGKCETANAKGEFTEKLLTGETESIEGTSGPSFLESPSLGITIECAEDTFTGTMAAAGLSTGEVKFYRCRVVVPATCKVKEPIEFKFKDKLVGAATEPVNDEFEPETGTTFVEITLSGCTAEGKYKVEGTQTCSIPAAGQGWAVHEMICNPYGSKLKLGTGAAYFTSDETVRIDSGKPWDAI
jgi:hypothetical protein